MQWNISTIDDVDKLRAIGKDLQERTRTTEVDNEVLRKRLQTQDSSIQSLESCLNSDDEPLWIAAEDDYPEQDSKVVYFDGRDFQVTLAKHLSGKSLVWNNCRKITKEDHRVTVSKLRTKWPGAIYMYTESSAATPKTLGSRVRITSKKREPKGLRWTKTLNLGKLPIETKMRVLCGNIEWLFVSQADSRRSTSESMDKKPLP